MQAVVIIRDRLKDLRIEQALTQRELADKAGIAPASTSASER